MSIRHRDTALGITLFGSALAVGCGSSPVERAEAVASAEQEVIGGFGASSAKLDAVGELVVRTEWSDGTTSITPFCTATLITPNTVLTAKHCATVFNNAHPYGQTVAFAVGADGLAPRLLVEAADIETAPGDEGGFIGIGRDVAVVHLIANVDGVTPFDYRPITADMLGNNFVVVGYGARDNEYTSGLRLLGQLKLAARTGSAYQALLGNFANFYEWYTGVPIPPECNDCEEAGTECTDPMVEWIRPLYDTQIEEGYEVVTGGAPGDAQPCFGDSGGPLLKVDASGQMIIYGVVSGGIHSRKLVCDYGAVFAALGPDTLAFTEKSEKWSDPCGGLTFRGVCEGTVAKRCTLPLEGPRRLVDVDCSLLGLSCERQADGRIACGSGEDATGMAPTPPFAGQTPPDHREQVNRVFKRPPL